MIDNPDYYINGVRCGDRKILSKTITLIESSLERHRHLVSSVIKALSPGTGKTIRLGITGSPGVGKSTLIEALGLYLIEEHALNVAVLAVDPSSAVSGGSIMGDKTRMEHLAANQHAFIRPSPAGGELGGVTRKTRESMLVCEAAGYDVIVVETVGVGQSEAAVAAMVDFLLVLIMPGAGDELQGMKRGLLELADALVVNKADGDNLENARLTKRRYESVMGFCAAESAWQPPVLLCSALEKEGIETIWNVVTEHHNQFKATGLLEQKRRAQAVEWMRYLLNGELQNWFVHLPQVSGLLSDLSRDVERGKLSPADAVNQLMSVLHQSPL